MKFAFSKSFDMDYSMIVELDRLAAADFERAVAKTQKVCNVYCSG